MDKLQSVLSAIIVCFVLLLGNKSVVLAEQTEIFSSGELQFIAYEKAFDFDTGTVWEPEAFESVDFVLHPGKLKSNGVVLSVVLEILGSAKIWKLQANDTSTGIIDQCISMYQTGDMEWGDSLEALSDGEVFCYVTDIAQPGYFIVRDFDYPSGLWIDWLTYEPPAVWDFEMSAVEKPETELDYAILSVEVTPDPVVVPWQAFTQQWVVQNTGTQTWQNYTFQQIEGYRYQRTAEIVYLPVTAPGETVNINISIIAPMLSRSLFSRYAILDANGNPLFYDDTNDFLVTMHLGEPGALKFKELGQDIYVEECFDFDRNSLQFGFGKDCDFKIQFSVIPDLIEFYPAENAIFSFETFYQYPPTLSECISAPKTDLLYNVDFNDWYLCFMTPDHQVGWIVFRDIQSNRLVFDWKLFE